MSIVAEIARLRNETNIRLARELVVEHPELSMNQALAMIERARKGE